MPASTIAAASLGGLTLLCAAPFALPGAVTVEREALIPAEPAAIERLLRSAAGFQTFNPWMELDPGLSITLSGPESGVGSSFAFDGRDGGGTQTITAIAPGRIVTEIDLGPLGVPVQTFTIDAAPGGARVVWTTDARFGWNPIGRVVGLFMDGKLGPVYELGLQKLAKAV